MTDQLADTVLVADRQEPRASASAEFRSLMSSFPTGVAVVTSADPDGTAWGMTCSTVCAVALNPPTLLVCLRRGSPTLRAMLRLSAFAVNLLHDGGQHTAELFASGATDRFDRVRWAREPRFGVPHLVDDAHAVADCEVTGSIPVGDHLVVFGEVWHVEQPTPAPRSPLLYGFRQYSSWSMD
jgi:flavin reductase (DIM6/NTAB) family NADH-FMN oxidoreductase RutF